jgi:hypothetical protein
MGRLLADGHAESPEPRIMMTRVASRGDWPDVRLRMPSAVASAAP